jgi:hypothetical protein
VIQIRSGLKSVYLALARPALTVNISRCGDAIAFAKCFEHLGPQTRSLQSGRLLSLSYWCNPVVRHVVISPTMVDAIGIFGALIALLFSVTLLLLEMHA